MRSPIAGWDTEAAWGGGKSTGPEPGDRGPKSLICTTKRLYNYPCQDLPAAKFLKIQNCSCYR